MSNRFSRSGYYDDVTMTKYCGGIGKVDFGFDTILLHIYSMIINRKKVKRYIQLSEKTLNAYDDVTTTTFRGGGRRG